MSQVATTVEGESEFNFNEWITQNELESVKELLTKHNATTPETLSMNASEFQKFMSDPQLFTKSHMIPKILGAVHNIMMKESLIKIIVSEQEAEVIDNIHKNIKSLNNAKKKIETLRKQHPKSITNIQNQKLEKLATTKQKVNVTFDNLCNIINKRRKILIDEIDAIKNEILANQNNSNDDDAKEYTSITQTVANCSKFLDQQDKIYDELTSTNDNRLDRKEKIINMGKDVQKQFKEAENKLNQHIQSVEKKIDTNKKTVVDIDLVIKNNKQQKIVKCVNKLGTIINTIYQSDEQKIDRDEKEDQDEEIIIKNLKQENQELKKKCETEQGIVKDVKQKNQELKKMCGEMSQQMSNAKKDFLTLTTFTNDDEYRWFNDNQDDEKQQNVPQCVSLIQQNPISIQFKTGHLKKNVSQNSLSLSPLVDDIQQINQYNQEFFKSFLNELKEFGKKASRWNVVEASHEVEKAKKLSFAPNEKARWSGLSEFPQWFVIETDAPAFIDKMDWKNHYSDKDTIKNFKLQVSNRSHDYDKDSWIDVQSFTSEQSDKWQYFQVSINENTAKSCYWRVYVESTYGGYTCLDMLKLTLS
eukprot:353552_1